MTPRRRARAPQSILIYFSVVYHYIIYLPYGLLSLELNVSSI